MSATVFRKLLEAGDVKAIRQAWSSFMPHLPQPDSYEIAENGMHMARTASDGVGFKYRAYSHRWLTERSLPSQLPDKLRPSAERLYPQVVEGVGISVNMKSQLLKPIKHEVQSAMEYAVEDCYANGDRAPALVRREMFRAKDLTMTKLVGRLYGAR